MNRPAKSTSTACTKLEAYCDFLESKVTTAEKEKDSLAELVSNLSMELTNEKLKSTEGRTQGMSCVHTKNYGEKTEILIPCNHTISYTGKCSHCGTPICKYCGGCKNKECRLFYCDGENK